MRDSMDVGRTTWITHEIELIPGPYHIRPVRRLNPQSGPSRKTNTRTAGTREN